jgi:hypothetical protein
MKCVPSGTDLANATHAIRRDPRRSGPAEIHKPEAEPRQPRKIADVTAGNATMNAQHNTGNDGEMKWLAAAFASTAQRVRTVRKWRRL